MAKNLRFFKHSAENFQFSAKLAALTNYKPFKNKSFPSKSWKFC